MHPDQRVHLRCGIVGRYQLSRATMRSPAWNSCPHAFTITGPSSWPRDLDGELIELSRRYEPPRVQPVRLLDPGVPTTAHPPDIDF